MVRQSGSKPDVRRDPAQGSIPPPVASLHRRRGEGKPLLDSRLGIPTVRDRVVQMATLLIMEPIFEADFEDCSWGFRPNRSAHQALEENPNSSEERFSGLI